YELMCQGPPWFNLGADTLPFGSGNVDWQSARDAALSSGLFIDGLEPGARVIIGADSIHLKETPGGEVQSYCMSGFSEQVAWIDNEPDEHILLRSMPPDSGPGITVPMTLGCNGSVYIMGDVLYEPVSGGMLGLIVKNGDVIIADTPEYDPWNGIWAVETEKEMVCSGSMLIPDGILYAENPWEPHPAADFTIAGGVQLEDYGITAYVSGQNTYGYFLQYDFDSRYFTASPPFYPIYDTGTAVSQGPAVSSFQPGFRVLRNPFGEMLEVELAAPADGPRELLLVDMSGRLVMNSTITDRRTLSTDRLPPGTYVLFLESPEGHGESLKVIKL
ncbi:MAG: T9SS type A sorting domain-containing protein, partial [Candidatus Aegiribacteria sp.]